MTIQLNNISKRYGFEWIFKQINFQFQPGERYAIVGPNGSGKSTLLKIISGGLVPTSGKIDYSILHKRIVDDIEVARKISFAAPYISLIEDFTLEEMYAFHASFKKMKVSSAGEFLDTCQLTPHRNKYIRNFSSGMKQRLKLALAFLSDTETLLLDEPTSNFDTHAIDWYLGMIDQYTSGRMIIIGSNQEHEYSFCKQRISVADFKQAK
jgi:ABC-type multidrug transport system ATPase subunit